MPGERARGLRDARPESDRGRFQGIAQPSNWPKRFALRLRRLVGDRAVGQGRRALLQALHDAEYFRRRCMDAIQDVSDGVGVWIFVADGIAQRALALPVGGARDDPLLLHQGVKRQKAGVGLWLQLRPR
jgi:hypothetical protein